MPLNPSGRYLRWIMYPSRNNDLRGQTRSRLTFWVFQQSTFNSLWCADRLDESTAPKIYATFPPVVQELLPHSRYFLPIPSLQKRVLPHAYLRNSSAAFICAIFSLLRLPSTSFSGLTAARIGETALLHSAKWSFRASLRWVGYRRCQMRNNNIKCILDLLLNWNASTKYK